MAGVVAELPDVVDDAPRPVWTRDALEALAQWLSDIGDEANNDFVYS